MASGQAPDTVATVTTTVSPLATGAAAGGGGEGRVLANGNGNDGFDVANGSGEEDATFGAAGLCVMDVVGLCAMGGDATGATGATGFVTIGVGIGADGGATGGGALGGVATGAAGAGLEALGAAAGAEPGAPEILNFRSLAPKTPITSSGTLVCFWLERLASPAGPIAAKIRPKGKSIRESSCDASFANVPGGAAWRNCAKGTRTAPVRNCSTATEVERENVPGARFKTSAAKSSGNRERMSFNGNVILSPASVALRAGAVAAGLVARAAMEGAAGVEGLGGGGGDAGAGTDSSVTAPDGRGVDGLENNLLKTPNIKSCCQADCQSQVASSIVIYMTVFNRNSKAYGLHACRLRAAPAHGWRTDFCLPNASPMASDQSSVAPIVLKSRVKISKTIMEINDLGEFARVAFGPETGTVKMSRGQRNSSKRLLPQKNAKNT